MQSSHNSYITWVHYLLYPPRNPRQYWLGGRSLGESSVYTGDIVVVRDDNGGTGSDPYRDLVEHAPPRGDGMPGVRVARHVRVPFVNEHAFGQERLGPRLSLAVDPRSSSTVYWRGPTVIGTRRASV